jgi:hypothetical protein
MIRKRLQKRTDEVLGGYQPRLVITVEGLDDVYRLARHLEQGQVEFSAMGRRILTGMDRHAPGVVHYLQERMGPARGGYRGRRRRLPQLRLGMPAEELDQLARAVRS